jgi:glycosyltransferase involved in cell wall biosynthesis
VRLRSLHLDSGRSWRGGQRQVLLLAEGLRARGDEPLVVGVPGAPLVERAHTAGLATAVAPMRNDWDLRSSNKIRALIRTWRPHIVHAHDARSHAIALLALRGSRRATRTTPLIVTRRVTFPPKSLRLKYGPRVTRFIAISHAVKRAMVEAGIAEHRIDVVHSGVPTPAATAPRDWRQELGWPEDTVVVGIVGAMTAEKGVSLVGNIVSLLPDPIADRTRIVFLGGHTTGRARLGRVEVFHAGFVSEIYDAMAGLDLLWHPALEEGLGTALIDSLALKVPPIAFSVGGIPELVEHGKSGILVPRGDLKAFAEAHISLLDRELRAALAEAGPDRAKLFNVSKMTETTVQVYEKVLSLSLT